VPTVAGKNNGGRKKEGGELKVRIVKASEVKKLKLQGLSFSQIGHILKIHKGVAYRLYKKGLFDLTYSEKVGNKPRRNKRDFCLIWEQDKKWAEVLYIRLPRFLSKFLPPNSEEFQEIYDYCLNFAYTTPQLLEARKPIAYFWGCVRKRVCGVFVSEIKRKEVEKDVN